MSVQPMFPPVLLFHGGTGSTGSPETDSFGKTLLRDLSVRMEKGAGAIDLAVECVTRLEECGLFNAGRGAVSQADGVVRRDAGAMDGRTLDALGASGVEGIPSMARLVAALLGKSGHVHLNGDMVRDWALRHGWTVEKSGRPPSSVPTLLWEAGEGEAQGGTVGCVVRDFSGNLAAVTSTGGIGRMWPGRIGDSPIVGGGFFADNRLGAISMTGVGESILKAGGGLAILTRIEGKGATVALEATLDEFFRFMYRRFGGTAGCIGIDLSGRPFAAHSSSRMFHGLIDGEGVCTVSDVGHLVGLA